MSSIPVDRVYQLVHEILKKDDLIGKDGPS